jgi:GTPase SAR1 family protein
MVAFGQLVCGPPGAGKTTYCHGTHQVSLSPLPFPVSLTQPITYKLTAPRKFLTALNRPVAIINLDPAVPNPPYPCAVNITDLISLEEIMEEFSLGPNGAMLYAMEYLETNLDWLEEKIQEVLIHQDEERRGPGYLVFDTPGQVELWTNHDSLKRIITKFTKKDYRVRHTSFSPDIPFLS